MKIDEYYKELQKQLDNAKTYNDKRKIIIRELVDSLTSYVELKDDIRNLTSVYKLNKINLKTNPKYSNLKPTQQREEIYKDLFNDEQEINALKYERDCYESIVKVLNIMLDVDD